MLVYGERTRTADPRALIAQLRADLAALSGQPAGIERHAALVAALIAAGELAQGLADTALEASGADGPEPASDAAIGATTALARAVVASWRAGFGIEPDLSNPVAALAALAALPLPAAVTTKVGEGYAFYALYPEAYAEAAAGLDAAVPTTVIGLRSIGASLAAVVAAALDAPPPITVRPTGHPFRRTLSLAPDLAATLSRGGDRRFAVVDEGPGLSGSSFGAVVGRLEADGVPRGRIAVFPSHAGDLGPQASAEHRERWRALDRRTVDFEALILRARDPAHRLEAWVADLTGPAIAPLQDLSGGAWRTLRYAGEPAWPPSQTQQERRKYLIRTESGAFLLKFVGLGPTGARKLEQARALAEAGFCAPPLGLRHGFMVERWIAPRADAAPGRPSPERIAAYLGFRARAFPAEADEGASMAALFEMARANVEEGLGVRAAGAVERWRSALPRLEARVRRIWSDNRMHRWEWLRGSEGRWFKAFAVDHADAHDLVGAQDVAWDVVGAAVELEMGAERSEALRQRVGLVDSEIAAFFALAYPAFQLGLWTMALNAHAHDPSEQARLALACDRYAERLSRATSAGRRPVTPGC